MANLINRLWDRYGKTEYASPEEFQQVLDSSKSEFPYVYEFLDSAVGDWTGKGYTEFHAAQEGGPVPMEVGQGPAPTTQFPPGAAEDDGTGEQDKIVESAVGTNYEERNETPQAQAAQQATAPAVPLPEIAPTDVPAGKKQKAATSDKDVPFWQKYGESIPAKTVMIDEYYRAIPASVALRGESSVTVALGKAMPGNVLARYLPRKKRPQYLGIYSDD